ncbi:hypothetical protein [Dyella amyloliquefaciens]|uniref:hypothetical protein n=1 Tax=Dyella amyloliquefaciens TaxID=1770545 RepID=UPI00102EC069|nr:hypothetical protein [Dyella amyloliquefaciens]
MTATMHFPYAGLLARLESSSGEGSPDAAAVLPPSLERALSASDASKSDVVAALAVLLKARKATLQAAFDTTLAADELRRYQKFAKPGKPSAHIVQLRQKQAAARQATSIARQSLIKAAAAFVRDAGIDVPARTPLDVFIIDWIDVHVPREPA